VWSKNKSEIFLPLSSNVPHGCLGKLALLCIVANRLYYIHHVNQCNRLSRLVATTLRPQHTTHRFVSNQQPTTRINTVGAHLLQHRTCDITFGDTSLKRQQEPTTFAQNKNHVDQLVITNTTPNREYTNKHPDSSRKKAPSRRHSSLSHQVKNTTTTAKTGSIATHQPRETHKKMCITYISLHTSCGCPSDSLFEPCDKAIRGNCGFPTKEVILKSTYEDEDEDDDDNADDVRICEKCVKELKESVRKLFERFRTDGVKVASRAGDQVFLVGDDAWSLDCD
jgi:hypothetical protein